jgi:RNA polymerase sigma-70 factor (ECF subfamily)
VTVEPPPVDPDAASVLWFEGLFAATYDDLLRYAWRRVGPVSAPDVVAEVFLTAWRRRDDYDRDAARLWLFGVARRVVANANRSALRARQLSTRVAQSAAAEPDPADVVVAHIHVHDVIAQLPEAEAEALRLVAWDGFDLAEAAVIAGCSAATFRVRLFRGRRRAAQMLAVDVRAERGVPSGSPAATEGSGSG